MAIDSAAKRHSAQSWGLPWRSPPFPSGTIGAPGRAAVALLYAGIDAGSPVDPYPDITFTARARGLVWSAAFRGTVWTANSKGR